MKTRAPIPAVTATAATPPCGVMTRDAGADPFGGERRAYDFELELTRASVDADARTIAASMSSEIPVERFFGAEILKHSKDAVDLARATHGLPLLFNHDRDQPLGVVRELRVDDGRLHGTLHFAASARALEVWEQVRDGFLSNMSIGYRVAKWEHDEDAETHTATRWAVLEASVVTVPADHLVGIGRAAAPAPAHATRDDGDGNVTSFEASRRQAHAEGRLAGEQGERARIAGIRELFARPRFQTDAMRALCDDLIDAGVSVEAARARLLDALGSGAAPVASGARVDHDGAGRHVSAGEDGLDKFASGAATALAVRAGLERDDQVVRDIRANEFYGLTLAELAREYLRRGNVAVTGLTRMDLVGQAFTRAFVPGQGTSAFANVLGNTAEKAMMTGYDEAAETWDAWTRPTSLRDFKSVDRVNLSGFGDLDELGESGEFKIGRMADLKETIKLATYGKIFNLSRQAIINDDLDAFTDVPMKMGRAASRKVGDVAYAVLTSNPTLNQDATALFHANHNNLVASGAAPSVTTLDAGFTAMATQTAPSPDGTATGHRVNVRPAFILVPVALEISTQTLIAATYDPAGTAGTLKPNPFTGRMQVVSDARLDADSATAWYLAADWRALDTVEVAFLDGERRPFLDQQEGWTVDGVSFKVRLDAAAIARDFRGLYKNNGA